MPALRGGYNIDPNTLEQGIWIQPNWTDIYVGVSKTQINNLIANLSGTDDEKKIKLEDQIKQLFVDALNLDPKNQNRIAVNINVLGLDFSQIEYEFSDP